ncbi:hypothetical protein RE628_17530 [Paenibacillus sp. D2_2]|uniref:hypothetical protein n=1 Tax=Paenibacillus sp. D2_2 TaxID=3073092 RepID=UPI002814B98D|nr:hypothetical protein [Paenibacillus sp. D2_2]WMT39253.1 hypothetical protein RE628_17530 [Paenibacillus sp. D2_2]
MNLKRYACEIVTKTFTTTSIGELDEKMGYWRDSNPDSFVISMEMSSHWDDLNKQVVYVVLMAYQVGEKDGL